MARTYKSEIMSWDWDKIVEKCKGEETYDGAKWEFIGTVFNLAPSGKYYMPWTTNQTADDVRKDEAFYAALDEVAEKHGGYISAGDGDPCDLFFCLPAEDDDETEDE